MPPKFVKACGEHLSCSNKQVVFVVVFFWSLGKQTLVMKDLIMAIST